MRKLISLLLITGSLAISGSIAYYWLSNRPRAHRKTFKPAETLVEAIHVENGTYPVTVDAMGTVIAARDVDLKTQVSGKILYLSPNFVPGGRFEAGQIIAKIEPDDYELAVEEQQTEISRRKAELEQKKNDTAQRRADVIQAESELKLEKGRQDVARQEYELLGKSVEEQDLELVFRYPQLAKAKANYEAALAAKSSAEAAEEVAEASINASEVALKKARLDLKRTIIRAPFNAVLSSKNVEIGSQVSIGSSLATLVGTDEFWVQISLPLDQLGLIDIPTRDKDNGANVHIYHKSSWGDGVYHKAKVIRLLTELEPQGRLARILAKVEDPLCLKEKETDCLTLPLGAYVRVEIEGKEIENVIPVPRDALRDGNNLWIMQDDKTLDIRKAQIIWRGKNLVYVRDSVKEKEFLIISDLAAPVAGMALRLVEGKSLRFVENER